MPFNILANVPTAAICIQPATFASLGLNSTNIRKIYKVGNPYQSWVPTSSLNVLSGFEYNAGYIIFSSVDLDLSAYLAPPIPGSTLDIQSWVIDNFTPMNRVLTINGVSYDLSQDRSWTITTGAGTLATLTDVSLSSPANRNFLVYNSSTSKWINSTIQASDIPDLSSNYLTVSTAASTYQPLNGNLTAIAGISSNGYLKRTGVNTWTVDNSTFLTSSDLTPYLLSSTAASTYQPIDGDLTAIAALTGTGLLKRTGSNTWALDTTAYESTANKGVANGYAPLDSSGLISSSYLPSYVDDVVEFANLAAFPTTGETGKIYVALDTNKTYRWSGSTYIEISAGDVNSVNGLTGVVTLTTSNISEGSNLYYTQARFDSAFALKSTSDLAEGSNLYFTTARVLATALTGLGAGSNAAITSTDTILQAFAKVQNQLNNKQASGSYQPLNSNLTSISSLSGTAGFVKTNGSGTYSVDTSTYLTANQSITFTASGDISGSASGSTSISPSLTVNGLKGLTLPALVSGFLTYNGTAWAFDTNTYVTAATASSSYQAKLSGTGFVKISGTTISYDNSTYLTANQTITLSGDVSGSGTTAITTTIGSNKVVNGMLAQMAANTIKGNNTGATANPSDLTGTQVTAMLDVFTTSVKGLTPASGGGTTNFLRADGTWAAPSGTGFTNPMTTLGDMLYATTGGAAARLAGNTATTKKFLNQTGDGTNSASPSWAALVAGDIPDLSATYLTVATASSTYLTKANNLSDVSNVATARTNLGATTVGGNLFTATNPSAITFIKISATNTVTFESAATHLTSLGAQAQLNGTGFVKVSGTTVSYDNSTYLTANQSISFSPNAGGDVTGGASGTTSLAPTLTIGANKVTDSKLRPGLATSVIGRSANTSGNVTDIAATADNQFLVRRSGALTWGTLTVSDLPSTKFSQTFNATTDWGTASGGYYSLTFTHNLGTNAVNVQIWDNTTGVPTIVATNIEQTTVNSVTIYASASPDGRFTGIAVIV